MPQSRLVLDPEFTIGPVPRRLFGSFVEHMGRCVYSGIYEPDHPSADAAGFRGDVLDLSRELGPTVVRYPGGNFVSGYRWEDGVGPRDQRPERLDLAWRSREPNAVGIHEFDGWARALDTEVMMAVNLGTRGIQEACDLLEYTNHPAGSYWSDRRIANGASEPFGYRLWCLGNEMDGPWQIGHKTADEYGRLAAETARAMRLVDPDIELVACGSSNAQMPTFGDWEAAVLRHAYDDVDYISLHVYYQADEDDPDSYLASAMDMDQFIEGVVATVDAEKARGRHRTAVDLSFDEWNVVRAGAEDERPDRRPWALHPRLGESEYTVADAVVVGTMLNSLLRHGDRVTIGCQAQLVNVLGLIRSEEGGDAWKQSIAHPFEQMRRLARGQILRVAATGDRRDTRRFTDVPIVDAAATFEESSGSAAVFLANRSRSETADVTVECGQLGVRRLRSAGCLSLPDGSAATLTNRDRHDAVGPQPFDRADLRDGAVTAQLPPLSWTVLELDSGPDLP
ncbi:alpha-N-arabinofuranosidase [Microlunatus elymi]|uniref:non-reducing end alpha-L-arabinofuranosidase n=1 Tax=Microlunatus elymi TaxID=2596828 RepID=A0A516Q0J8_9ACTN|nr:alpha-N-arabinofuranosidase [Microlunatus elymi]QDP96928.1 alpha-N-arabinofuranosidase [Microlunatus elymi]